MWAVFALCGKTHLPYQFAGGNIVYYAQSVYNSSSTILPGDNGGTANVYTFVYILSYSVYLFFTEEQV